MQELKASEEMQKFFDNLTELKRFIREKAEESNDPIINEIYNKFHKTFKIKGEDE